jgi:L-asparaginase
MIALLTTGGTIAGTVRASGAYSASVPGAALLAELQPHLGDTEIILFEPLQGLSFEITGPEWLGLAREIAALVARPDIAGVVVAQGTALLEEVPFLMGLFVAAEKPLVFTGAMSPMSVAGSDGLRNLLDAILVAADARAAARGPLVVMGRRVIRADRVIKRHRGAPDALVAADGVVDGAIDGAGVRWLCAPHTPPAPLARVALAWDVPLISAALGMPFERHWRSLDPLPPALVVEGFPGGGGVPAAWVEGLLALAAQVPVVLSARSPEGRLTGGAGGRSGGGALTRQGLFSAGAHSTARARLLTMATLGQEPSDPHEALRDVLQRWDPDHRSDRRQA